jgi:hypothetical protein
MARCLHANFSRLFLLLLTVEFLPSPTPRSNPAPSRHFNTVTIVTRHIICHYENTKRSSTTTNSVTFPSFETNTKPFMSLSTFVCLPVGVSLTVTSIGFGTRNEISWFYKQTDGDLDT